MAAEGKAVAAATLRRRAEAKLKRGPAGAALGAAQTDKLIHELQVHQIELEMQNEELLRTRSQAEEALARYTTLYDFAPVGYCTLNPNGLIMEMNLTAARILGATRSELIDRRLGSRVDSASLAPLKSGLAAVFAGQGVVTWELGLKDGGEAPTTLRVEAVVAVPGKSCFAALVDISATVAAGREREQARARLAAMSQRLVAVQEEERRRLSLELHDHTSGNLAALGLLLSNLERKLPKSPQSGASVIADIQALLRATAAEIRAVCGDLRPPLLDFAGIVPALESYARSLMERHGIAVRVEVRGKPRRLSPEIETTLFRIAQEALTNCFKHAAATAVRVLLDGSGERTALEISDDGAGFRPGRVAKARLGLRMMRERAEFAGGSFSVASHPGKGTKIRVEF